MGAEAPQQSEPLRPATAGSPAEALALLSEALSDGDVEAAVSLCEPGAVLSLAPGDRCRGRALEEALAQVASMKLAVETVSVDAVVASGLALVLARRAVAGVTPTGVGVGAAGQGAAVLRKRRRDGWRFLVDHWGFEGSLNTGSSGNAANSRVPLHAPTMEGDDRP